MLRKEVDQVYTIAASVAKKEIKEALVDIREAAVAAMKEMKEVKKVLEALKVEIKKPVVKEPVKKSGYVNPIIKKK